MLKAGAVSAVPGKPRPLGGTRDSQQRVCEDHCSPVLPSPAHLPLCIPALLTGAPLPFGGLAWKPKQAKKITPQIKANSLLLVKIPKQMATDSVAS